MGPGLRRALYACTIFSSALLLFLVQPVMARAILPWFGGSAGVWTTSMLFFQVLLLLGYLYAHAITRRLGPRTCRSLHAGLLAASVALLPIVPGARVETGWRRKPGVAHPRPAHGFGRAALLPAGLHHAARPILVRGHRRRALPALRGLEPRLTRLARWPIPR